MPFKMVVKPLVAMIVNGLGFNTQQPTLLHKCSQPQFFANNDAG